MCNIDIELQERLSSPEPALGDAGFSDNVLRQLPARRPRLRAHARRLTLAGACGMGGLLTMLLAEPFERLLALSGPVPAPLVTVAVFILVVSIPLAWIFHSE